MLDRFNDSMWKSEGKCYELVYTEEDLELRELFFAETVSERTKAAAFCADCPVQQRCLRYALESSQTHGVWGGRDEIEIRRDSWINSSGKPGNRSRNPRCAWCREKDTLFVADELRHRVECSSCGFTWKSATTQMGVEGLDVSQIRRKYTRRLRDDDAPSTAEIRNERD